MNNYRLNVLGRIMLLITFILSLVACSGGGSAPTTTSETATAAPAAAANPTLGFDTKTFRFSWTDVSDATHYRLLENPDGSSGSVQVGSDIAQSIQSVDHIVPLYARINASYILQSCNTAGCTDSSAILITGALVDAIGYFKASTGVEVGSSVSLSADGNTLAVGATSESSNTSGINTTPNFDGTANASGAAYVFSRSDTTWSEQAYIKASNTGADDGFGDSIALSADGNTLAVGARSEDSNTTGINTTPNDDGAANNSGAVYVFSRSGTIWSEQAYIKASNTGAADNFSEALSLSADGNTLVVGAKSEDSNTVGINTMPNDDGAADNSGAAYVFSRSGTAWSQQAYIKASNTGASDFFGAVGLSADGNTLAVGATNEDSNTTGFNTTPNDDGTANTSGAAYVFSRSGTAWSQQAYIKASNNSVGDRFGSSVGLSADGNTLAASARFDDSNTTGINTTPNIDGNADFSGAAYVFSRSGTTWSEQAYIKASNTGASDAFGRSVCLSADGNTLAVGASNESSDTVGINTTPNDDGVGVGAVYVY